MLIRALTILGTKDKDGNGPIRPGYAAEVDDTVGQYYIERGVAVEVSNFNQNGTGKADPGVNMGENPSTGGDAQNGALDAENGVLLEEMTFPELKAMANDMGIKTAKIRSKAGMISAITAAQMDLGDGLPDLTPQDVIEE